MYQKILSLFLCLISVFFVNNPAMALTQNSDIVNKINVIEKYNVDFSSYMNVSENSEPIFLVRERSSRNSGEMSIAWIGSIFLAGLGQMLLGEVGRGILFMLGTVAGYALFVLPGLALHIWSIFDAYNLAKEKAEGNDEEARVLKERIARVAKELDKVSIGHATIKYDLANF